MAAKIKAKKMAEPINEVGVEALKDKALSQVVEENLKRVESGKVYPLSVMLITQPSDLEKTERLFPTIPAGVEVVVVCSVPCKDDEAPHHSVEVAPDDKFGKLTSIVNHFKGDFNFSQARNIGIDYCERKWIMWVDSDDELSRSAYRVFEDLETLPDGIGGIYGFLYGYQPQFGGIPQDFYAAKQVRIFRNHPSIRFEGTTHEQIILSINRQHLKLLHAPLFIEHFGYICGDEEMKAKIVRNLKGLASDFANGLTDPSHLQGVLDLLERDSGSYNKIIKTY